MGILKPYNFGLSAFELKWIKSCYVLSCVWHLFIHFTNWAHYSGEIFICVIGIQYIKKKAFPYLPVSLSLPLFKIFKIPVTLNAFWCLYFAFLDFLLNEVWKP